MSIFSHFQQRFEATRQEEYSLQEYLDLCKADPRTYASAAERLLMAIGEPELVDTSTDPRLSRIFSNKVIRRYPAFEDFHGMEECIDQIVSYFRHAAQGLEEKKQILYLLGPVGGGKSSLAEKLKQLMERVPFYAIKGSPVFESPLGLFNPVEDAQILEEDYGIPPRYLNSIMSPWATKRLQEFGGDISKFRVVKLYPSILNQIAVAKTEPGDENNQDISSLVGKVDIRKLEEFPQNDADAYSYSGALCRANQGLMEFVEMFKAPIKVLHPLLTATQEGNYNSTEGLLMAIGEPELVDTSTDPRLSRIFSNKVIRRYPAFEDFHGMEECIDQIVSYFRHAAQGLEEKKQILYLLGPVGGGKSSLAEKLKQLMERVPFYAIKGSPVFESPLGLFNPVEDAQILEEDYGIPPRYLNSIMSPWATKRLQEFGGDISKFRVVKLYPSILNQIAVAKTEPGDENNQDISSLVGKVDIRKLEEFPQNDADAYSYSGALCRANQGLMEFVEMFKAPIKVLHPLLTATQEGNYNSTEGLGAIPYSGILLAHSNESEWHSFRNNKNNEAFIDRIYIVKVPYCLRVSDEIKIYDKLLANSSLSRAHCAPDTLKMLAQFSVLSRLKEPENSNIYSKMRVYDGENLKDTDPKAKSIQEYRDAAGVDEGMNGLSTRFAFKILSKVFNFDP